MGGKNKKKAARDDSDDDDFVDPIKAALAAEAAEAGDDQSKPTNKKPTKAQLRKLKQKANRAAQDDPVDPPEKAASTAGDDDGDDDEDAAATAPVPVQPVKKLSKAELRKQKKKGKGRGQEDSDDDFEDPIAKAMNSVGDDEDDDDDDEEPASVAPEPVKKLSRAQLRKQKKKGGKGRVQEDSDDDFEDPIAKAMNSVGDEEDDDDDEEAAVVFEPVKKPSKAELKKQKKRQQSRGQVDDDDEEDPIPVNSSGVDGDEDEEDDVDDKEALAPPPVEEEEKAGSDAVTKEPKKKLSKAERKRLKRGGVIEDVAEVAASTEAPAQPRQIVETGPVTKADVFKPKSESAPSAFATALAKKYEEKKEDEEDEAFGNDEDVALKLAKYEKKLAKAEKKGENADEIERYRGKVAKYKARLEEPKSAPAASQKEDFDAEQAALAAGGLLSGKDGEAWRDDSNDLPRVEDTFEEALAAAVKANDGKPLGSKAKKKLEKDWNARKRAALELADKEKRSVAGAQFAVSQSTVNENDANWINALDIKIDSFSISAAGKTLFENASLQIVHGKRYGIVGPNGRGKTTLLKMISSGELKTPPRIQCLYVEQEVVADDTPAVDAVLKADKERNALMEEEKELTELLAATELSPDEKEGLSEEEQRNRFQEKQRETTERLAEVSEQLVAIGAHSAESKARRILFGLGFSAEMQMRPTKLFSGGWRMRISLARALFIEPTLLMLDEPTNHLDLNAVIWLDDYLQKYKHTIMIVSHDQDFLNSVCVEILHISEDRKLDAYRGDYDAFKTLERQKRAQQQKEWEKQQKQIRGLKSKGNTSKAKAEELVLKQGANKREAGARSKKQAVALGQDSMDVATLVEKPHEYLVSMEFPECAQLSPPVLQVCDAGFRYSPDLPYIFTDMNFGIDQQTRVCVVGNNGSGKSTLLNLLTGKLDATEGEIKRNPRLRMGVYNQHFVERLPMDESPVDYLRRLFNDATYQSIRNMLGRYGLSGHAHTISMRDLSGGQKARVVLCELSLANPHMLLLDEPTNNLDIETIDALCDAINEYNGGVVCVTHDARLIEATDMRLWVVENRQVTEWGEPFDAYRDHLLASLEEAMAQDDQRVTAAGLSVDMGGNRN